MILVGKDDFLQYESENMITIEQDDKPDSNWNGQLLDFKMGTIAQAKESAQEILKNNQKPLFLKFLDSKGNIVGQLLASHYSLLDNRGIKGKFLKKILSAKKEMCEWSNGPIIFNHENDLDIYSALNNFLINKNWKVNGVTDPIFSGDIGILKKNFQVQQWSTYLIDLSKSKEELYAGISKHSGRKNIERAINRGVEVEEIHDERTLIEYNNLRNEMRKKVGKKTRNIEQVQQRWNLFKPLGISGMIARKNNQTIGGLAFTYFNGQIIEGGVARSEIDFNEKLYSQDLIKWKIIEWGIKHKMKYYNLAGFNPNPASSKEIGIKRYKEKWGGELCNYWIIKK